MSVVEAHLPSVRKSYDFTAGRVGLLVVGLSGADISCVQSEYARTNYVRERTSTAVPLIVELADAVRRAGGPVLWAVPLSDSPTRSDWPPGLRKGKFGLEPSGYEAGSPTASHIEPGGYEREDYLLPSRGLSAFWNAGADSVLRNRGVRHLLVVGRATEYSVLISATDATHRGYEVTIVEDGCIAVSEERHDAALLAHPHQYAVAIAASTLLSLRTGLAVEAGSITPPHNGVGREPSERDLAFGTELTAHPERRALVVVDLNSANVDVDSAFGSRLQSLGYDLDYFASRLKDRVIPNVNALAAQIRRGGGMVVWVRPEWRREDCSDWPPGYYRDVANMGHTRSYDGMDSFQMAPELDVDADDQFVSKFCTSAFWGSNLTSLMQNRGIADVLVSGCVTNGGVVLNAIDSASIGFRTTIVEDASAALTHRSHVSSLVLQSDMFNIERTEALMPALAIP
jgi:nicotinamidase-related amidase